jgi:imidazolonepropionase
LLLTNVGRVFTATGAGVIVDGAVVVDDGRIAWVGPAADAPGGCDERVDVEGALLTPGLIDAHTHPVYAGERLAEIALRSTGAGYREIAAAGGGIQATVAATRAAAPGELEELVRGRLASWLAHGTTTVEAKTGYHLDRAGEIAAVTLLARLATEAVPPGEGPPARATDPAPGTPAGEGAAGATVGRLPRVEVTFLGAHDVGPEVAEREPAAPHEACATEVAGWMAEAAAAGARFVDVFCDAGFFSVDQARRVLLAGRAAGLRPRIHADELERTGGSLLAAELHAVSADHLLCVTDEDAHALGAAGVVGTLCPITALAMRRTPPARTLADQGVTLALGSDHNPGQSGTTSMSLVVGLAVHVLGLSVDEALTAATAGGARSVATPDRGAIRPGAVADLVAWDADHEGAFAWDLGLRPRRVWKGGVSL